MTVPLSAHTETFEHMKRSGDYYVTVVEDTNLGQIVATATLVIEHKFTHSCAKVNSLTSAVKWGKKILSSDSVHVIYMVWWSTLCWVSNRGTLKISPILGRSAKQEKEALALSSSVSMPFSFWTQAWFCWSRWLRISLESQLDVWQRGGRGTQIPLRGRAVAAPQLLLGAGRGITSMLTAENPSTKCRAVGKLPQQCLTNTFLYFHSEGG